MEGNSEFLSDAESAQNPETKPQSLTLLRSKSKSLSKSHSGFTSSISKVSKKSNISKTSQKSLKASFSSRVQVKTSESSGVYRYNEYSDTDQSPEQAETSIIGVDCDEMIKSLVDNSKTKRDSKVVHEPGCPLGDEPEEQYDDDNKPCPPGVRRCCTCGVCPLDMVGKGAGLVAGEGADLDGAQGGKTAAGSDGYTGGPSTTGFGSGVWSEGWGSEGGGYDRYARDQKDKDWKKFSGFPSLSDISRHEGSITQDYPWYHIIPFGVCEKTLSEITSSYVSCEETGLQRTIVIVKPKAVKFKEAIYRVIFEAGFQILGLRVIHLTPEQVSEIYSKYYGSPSFVHLVVSISEAPVLAICISAMNVIKRWLNIIGPDGALRAEWFYPLSMRKLFGLENTHADWIHGSENLRESNKENRYFYPNAIIEPLIDDLEKVTDYCAVTMNKAIVEACTEVVKKRPADPIIFFAEYLLLHNPFQPRFPNKIAMTPT